MSNIASIAPKIKERDATRRLGRNVRYIMDERGISQVELARRLGLTESQVSRRVGGGVKWTPDDIEETAEALGVTIDLLFKLELPTIVGGGRTLVLVDQDPNLPVNSRLLCQIELRGNGQQADDEPSRIGELVSLADYRERKGA